MYEIWRTTVGRRSYCTREGQQIYDSPAAGLQCTGHCLYRLIASKTPLAAYLQFTGRLPIVAVQTDIFLMAGFIIIYKEGLKNSVADDCSEVSKVKSSQRHSKVSFIQ